MDNIAFLVITIVAIALVIPYLYMHISAVRSVGRAVPLNALPVQKSANLDRPVYCYFMSANCSMCKPMTPIIEQLQTANANIVIIDINLDPQLAKDFHVFGTPTLMTIDNGEITKVRLGKLKQKKIEQFISG